MATYGQETRSRGACGRSRHWGVGLLALLALGLSGAAWGQASSMFSDPRAAQIGDVLTVIISENASATNKTSTTSDKINSLDISSTVPGAGNLLGFVPLHALTSEAQNTYEGTAATSRSARLNARMTVTVVGRKANGDLIIDGVRTLKINGETEAIHLSGTVNPVMISASNTIPSSSVGDLTIEYTGKGVITQGSRPGVLVRFVNWLF